jgi:hypothetical protein
MKARDVLQRKMWLLAFAALQLAALWQGFGEWLLHRGSFDVR